MFGTVTRLELGRGFGFIVANGESRDIFFHADDLRAGLQFNADLQGAKVDFVLWDRGGKPRAIEVEPVSFS